MDPLHREKERILFSLFVTEDTTLLPNHETEVITMVRRHSPSEQPREMFVEEQPLLY